MTGIQVYRALPVAMYTNSQSSTGMGITFTARLAKADQYRSIHVHMVDM